MINQIAGKCYTKVEMGILRVDAMKFCVPLSNRKTEVDGADRLWLFKNTSSETVESMRVVFMPMANSTVYKKKSDGRSDGSEPLPRTPGANGKRSSATQAKRPATVQRLGDADRKEALALTVGEEQREVTWLDDLLLSIRHICMDQGKMKRGPMSRPLPWLSRLG